MSISKCRFMLIVFVFCGIIDWAWLMQKILPRIDGLCEKYRRLCPVVKSLVHLLENSVGIAQIKAMKREGKTSAVRQYLIEISWSSPSDCLMQRFSPKVNVTNTGFHIFIFVKNSFVFLPPFSFEPKNGLDCLPNPMVGIFNKYVFVSSLKYLE